MPTKGRHQKKEVQEARDYALAKGWRLERRSGHTWGFLLCNTRSREGCRVKITSTPQNPGNAARRIRDEVDACPHP